MRIVKGKEVFKYLSLNFLMGLICFTIPFKAGLNNIQDEQILFVSGMVLIALVDLRLLTQNFAYSFIKTTFAMLLTALLYLYSFMFFVVTVCF